MTYINHIERFKSIYIMTCTCTTETWFPLDKEEGLPVMPVVR